MERRGTVTEAAAVWKAEPREEEKVQEGVSASGGVGEMNRGRVAGVTALLLLTDPPFALSLSTILGPGRFLLPHVGAVCPGPLLGKGLRVES